MLLAFDVAVDGLPVSELDAPCTLQHQGRKGPVPWTVEDIRIRHERQTLDVTSWGDVGSKFVMGKSRTLVDLKVRCPEKNMHQMATRFDAYGTPGSYFEFDQAVGDVRVTATLLVLRAEMEMSVIDHSVLMDLHCEARDVVIEDKRPVPVLPSHQTRGMDL